MGNTPTIKAITLDLDDTLWPIWPAIRRAEKHLHEWLKENAPATAAATSVDQLRVVRERIEKQYPEHKHDLSFYRREAIRESLRENGDDENLADEGFKFFFSHRQNVELFNGSYAALEHLSKHFPIVAITNGNADLKLIGLEPFFQSTIRAQFFGVGKPDPRIFLEAARILDIEDHQQILHIGDDFELDVKGAYQVGFQTAWVKHPSLNISDVDPQSQKMANFIADDLIALCKQLKLPLP